VSPEPARVAATSAKHGIAIVRRLMNGAPPPMSATVRNSFRRDCFLFARLLQDFVHYLSLPPPNIGYTAGRLVSGVISWVNYVRRRARARTSAPAPYARSIAHGTGNGISAAARRASPRVRNTIARSRSPQRSGITVVSHSVISPRRCTITNTPRLRQGETFGCGSWCLAQRIAGASCGSIMLSAGAGEAEPLPVR
jgi:hypothetical protein